MVEVPDPNYMNFDEPESEWTPLMKQIYFREGRATFTDPYSKAYKTFYTTIYSFENITYKEPAKGSGTDKTNNPSDNHPGNWLVNEVKSQVGGFFASEGGEDFAKAAGLAGADLLGPISGGFIRLLQNINQLTILMTHLQKLLQRWE